MANLFNNALLIFKINICLIFFTDNPFECGCDLKPLRDMLPNLKYSDIKDVQCLQQPESYKKVSLKELSFEELNCKYK